MSEDTRVDTPLEDLPMQDHRCTAVIEDLCDATPDDAWDEAE